MKKFAPLLIAAALGLMAGLGYHTLHSWADCFPDREYSTQQTQNSAPIFPNGKITFAQDEVAEPGLGDILKDGQAVVKTWNDVGVLAGVLALVMFLIKLTKLGFIGAAIKRNKLGWIRPLLAMAAAGLTASAAALVLGQSGLWVVLAGVMAGLVAPGVHEFIAAMQALFSKDKRAKLEAKLAP